MPPCRSVVPPGKLPLYFDIRGVEPDDPAWSRVSAEARREFWQNVGVIAMEVKQRELTLGLDHAGRKLRPVRYRKVRYRSGRVLDGEPLMPHRALARTRRLLRYLVQASSVRFYWAMGWGKILDYHRRGAVLKRGGRCVGRLPVRNVFGISPAGRREIARRARDLWLAGQKARPPIHDLIPAGGLSVHIPMDPVIKKPVTAADWRAIGVRAVDVKVTHRTVNKDTGIPGVKSAGVRLNLDWRKWKP